VLVEPDPDSVLSFPMSWRWVCPSGHVHTVGVDLSAGDDEGVVAVRKEDGTWERK
jgi:hypothetical protein